MMTGINFSVIDIIPLMSHTAPSFVAPDVAQRGPAPANARSRVSCGLRAFS